jgi:glycosyltransferase involved in cell wall biosynthesis
MMTPLRVLYCTDTYPPQINGVSVVTALSVAGLLARGWQVTVISPRYPASEVNLFENGWGTQSVLHHAVVPSVSLPGYSDIRLAAPCTSKVRRLIQNFQPHLVHSATEFMIGWTGQREAIRQGIPVVSSYHTDFSRYTEAYGMPWLRGTVQRYLARFHRRSNRVYTPGLLAGNDLATLGVSNVEIWGRGVDTNLFHPLHRDRRSIPDTTAGDDPFVFLHVGRLAAEKNVALIVQAYALARERLSTTHATRLIIAGDGPERSALRRIAGPGVTLLGNLDRQTDLPRLYASADAFLFASCTETLGLVILEAMASGLPVIAAPVGGVADHLRHGENGLAFMPDDIEGMAAAMVELVNNSDERRRLATGARRTAEQLGWDAELDRLDESYRERVIGRAVEGSRLEHAEPVVVEA